MIGYKDLFINVAIFTAGTFLGAAVTHFSQIKKVEKRISEIEEYYAETKGEYLRSKYTGSDEVEEKEETKKVIEHPSKKERINYQSFYKGNEKYINSDMVEEDLEESENEEDEISSQYDSWHDQYKNKPPKILSWKDAFELPEFIEHAVLYYYQGDDTLTSLDDLEEETPIEPEEVEKILGNCLDKFDWKQNSDDLLYVMNYQHDVCYEIQKKERYYQ